MTRPRVLLVAAFDEAHHAHALHRARALERLGCEVHEFDLEWRPGLLQRLRATGDLHVRLAETVRDTDPELVLVIGGTDVLTPARLAGVRQGNSVPWVNWFPDDLRTVVRAAEHAGHYDTVFAAASDVAGALGGALGHPVHLLPLAADPSVYRPVRSRDLYRANVVFAGRASRRREVLLAELVEFGLAIWGPGWRRTSLRDYCRGEVPGTGDYIRAYGGATLGINIHHTTPEAAQPEAHCNQRVFELAAMNVPQLVDQRTDLERWFTPGQDLLVYRDGAELRAMVGDLLHDPIRLETMAASARRELLARHTYMHRMSDLLQKADGRMGG